MLAFATLLSSIFSITSKNPVISVIFLISTFVSGAGYLILIGINFVGISYIIVYVGAIAVLFLFVIMMINIKLTDILETGNQYTKNLPLAIAIGSVFIFIIFSIIPFNFNNVPVMSIFLDKITYLNTILSGSSSFFQGLDNVHSSNLSHNVISIDLINTVVNNNNLAPIFTTQSSDVLINDFQQIEALGYSLYTYGAVLLITLSVILLLAMYATIVISSPTTQNSSPEDCSIKDATCGVETHYSKGAASAIPRTCVKVKKVKNRGFKAWFVTDILGGLKEGYTMPLYPEHVIKFNNNIYIRIFRNIGAICFFIYMCSKKIDFGMNTILNDAIWAISILYVIYRLILVIYSLKQGVHYIITGKYIVRNSPLNYSFTLMKLISGATKNTAGFIFGTGLAFTCKARP